MLEVVDELYHGAVGKQFLRPPCANILDILSRGRGGLTIAMGGNGIKHQT